MRVKTFIALIALSVFSEIAYAEIPDDQAIRALIGEAGRQSFDELYAHAHALRNRGSLKGVYGLQSSRAKNPTADEWRRASKAWYSSALYVDPTGGAKFWLSSYDIKHSRESLISWRHKMTMTCKIGETYFYRDKN